MPLHPPCELMMDSFLPSMRGLVSRKLSKEGFSQGRISRLVGVTQASVSLYLSTDPEKFYNSLSRMSITREAADRYSSLLAEDVKKNPVYAASTLYSIWSNLLGDGLLCSLHRRSYPFLAECDICMRTFGPPARDGSDAIDHVSRALKMIESSNSFVNIMPEVAVNVAYAAGDAKTVNEVVAIPGRIIKVRNSARSLSRPEYGASSHLAKMLILFRSRMKEVSAVINLRYDAKIARILKRLGLRTLETGGVYPRVADDPVVEALRGKLGEIKGRFDAIADVGGPGLEPSLYLLGRDAVEVAGLAIKISRFYAGS